GADRHAPLLEFEELMRVRAGGAAARPGGFVRLAYVDEVDGSDQFCRAYLPSAYDAARPWPLVVYLHGYNPPNPPYVGWWSADKRHDALAERYGVIFLEPHGRGNAQYRGIGERDVLRCLEEARTRLAVDADRVYLLGESMGGHGAWLIASRHPELFAAVAPVYGGWDWRLVPGELGPPGSPIEAFLQEAQSSFAGAEGLLNLPLFVQHGDQDYQVSVEHSRHAVRMLQRWGYPIRYRELPGWGHEDMEVRGEIVEWFLSHRRPAAPARVRLRAADLGGASAHWVRVEAIEAPLQLIEVDAEMVEPGLLRLDTRNAASVTLSPPPALLAGDRPLRVVWNGDPRELVLREGRGTLTSSGAAAGGLRTRPGLEGPLSDVINTPFALVVGTASPDPLMRRRCREKADAFAEMWSAWQHHPPRVFRDDEITAEQERRYSLFLIGGPDANRVTRRIADRLPLRLEKDAITVDGRRFAVADGVAQLVYPSPFAADRYVAMVAANSADGLYFWRPALWNRVFGYPTALWDWTIEDGRRAVAREGLAERTWVAAGVFDAGWRRSEAATVVGDPELRARGLQRGVPRPGLEAAGRLDDYVGRYELVPGVQFSVVQEGGRLVFHAPSLPAAPLLPEGAAAFGIGHSGTQVTFLRDGQAPVTGIALYDGGREFMARRLAP
ncbi:MAG TPA: prolyl oligopeptidase family serine peptidase, partial [Vicinamibacteria bacterium]